ncbi:MAG TPA: hypothetical protein VFW96_19315 [Thermomicrobiales bacterium]|nr:hypothetical protein [Thermomicrobiales bacterium]
MKTEATPTAHGADTGRHERPRLSRARTAELWGQHMARSRRVPRCCVCLAFLVTFLLVRGITYSIRYHWLPFLHDVQTKGGLHIHHLVWGVLLLLVAGYLAIEFDSPRRRGFVAVLYGVGAALALDEFALWLNLQDVYWARQGRESLDAIAIAAAVFLLTIAAHPFLRALGREARAVWRARSRPAPDAPAGR